MSVETATSESLAPSAPSGPRLPGYETIFISSAELSDEGLIALHDRLRKVVEDFGGELVVCEDWGKRKLAYPIAKESRGNYSYLVYSARGPVVAELERVLRLQDHVLRFLSVNLAAEFVVEVFQKRRTEIYEAAKRREEEREARREERNAERRGIYEDRRPAGDHHGEDHPSAVHPVVLPVPNPDPVS